MIFNSFAFFVVVIWHHYYIFHDIHGCVHALMMHAHLTIYIIW